MAKVTKKAIQAAIVEKYNLHDIEDAVDVHKCEGFYYWGGKAASILDQNWTGYQYLTDVTLERWLESFDAEVEEFIKWNAEEGETLRDRILKTNWDVYAIPAEPTVIKLGGGKS